MNFSSSSGYPAARVTKAALVALVAAGGAAMFSLVSERAAAQAPAAGFEIRSLSTRPDAVTGDDVLLQVKMPGQATPDRVAITVNGRDLTSTFHAGRDPNTLVGLVHDLQIGSNRVEAGMKGQRASAQLTLTDHPISGPVFSGPHQTPFVCETQALGLGAPLDADCTVNTKVEYFYRSNAPAAAAVANGAATPDTPNRVAPNPYKPFDQNAPRPADLAMTTTSDGRTVPYIVRREMGTINRAVYVIAFLHEPGTPLPNPWTAPTGGWNGKLVYTFGGGCQAGYHQGAGIGGLAPTASFFEDQQVGNGDYPLSKGYAITGGSLNVFGNNCADLISAETTMMIKEHFIEEFGVPKYTIGIGGSGGSMQQHMIANNYPGLLDGIIPGRSYTDNITFFSPLFDCELLNHVWDTSAFSYTQDQRTAISGYKDVNYCTLRATNYPNLRATNCNRAVPKELVYDAKTNPTGARCTYQDNMVNVFGRDPKTGFARRFVDNVGVQYGLNAFNDGKISFDQFLDLNLHAGGHDIDGNLMTDRTVGDPEALKIVYQTGRINEGKGGMATVPIIDLRSYVDGTGDVHDSHHSRTMRMRLQAANGTAANEVIVTTASLGGLQRDLAEVDGPLRTVTRQMFDAMGKWLDNIQQDKAAAKSQLEKVIRDKPKDLVDACYDDKIQKITDPAKCAQMFPYYGDPRIAAGEPMTADRLKCQLKPIDRKDYKQPVTDAQIASLKAAFSSGVCDYSKPGVSQGPSEQWLFYPRPGGSTSATN